MSDLHELSAAEQVHALHAGRVSSRDLTAHYLSRIEQLDAQLAAFAIVDPELAMAEAASADRRLAEGDRSPLLGLPLAVKDICATAGTRTTLGTAALSDYVPAQDSWTVRLLREAGGILLGKTTTSEFGATCFTTPGVTGSATVTPYDTSRYASGSSAGAAAAVAAGLLPVAHASDGAGSIRTPASTCHLVGVKPSRGLVSSAPASAFLSAGTEGSIARSVEDAALLLDVMAVASPGDLYGWHAPGRFVDAARQRATSPLKVAVWSATGIPGLATHPEAELAVQRAAGVLRQLGHDVREAAVPALCDASVREALASWFALSVGLAVEMLVPADRRDLLTPYSRWLVDQAASSSGRDALLAQTVLARYASTYLEALAEVDIALTPTTNGPPVAIGHFDADGPANVGDHMLSWSCYTPWANLTGQPAIALPSHLDADGLPHGVQLVGRQRHDAQVIALAAQLEEAGLWERVHPPCWNS